MKTHAVKCKSIGGPPYHSDFENLCDCDSYHTFEELYDHRNTLFIALCLSRIMERELRDVGRDVWRSGRHSDGSSFNGWFILGIQKEAGKQITYHLPLGLWSECNFAETLDRAPEFDCHTSQDVLERLKNL